MSKCPEKNWFAPFLCTSSAIFNRFFHLFQVGFGAWPFVAVAERTLDGALRAGVHDRSWMCLNIDAPVGYILCCFMNYQYVMFKW